MKIFVAGATGYLGGHFCEYLQEQGHEVVGFIRNPEKAELLDKWQIDYEVGDLTELDTIVDALQTNFDVVVNASGYANDRGSMEKFRRLNVETTEKLAQAMVATGHSRLIHTSSVAAYGEFGMGIDEEVEPTNHKWFKYGLTKLESEKVLENYDLEVTILRPPHIVGERDRSGFIPVLYHSFRKTNTWIEAGEARVPLVYVKDVCSALVTVIEHEEAIGEVYNVSSGEEFHIYEIAEILHDILGMDMPTKSYSFRYAYFLARVNEFLAKFGITPTLTRMAVMFGSKDASFPSDKLRELGWAPTKSPGEMITEWAQWRKEFEEHRQQTDTS